MEEKANKIKKVGSIKIKGILHDLFQHSWADNNDDREWFKGIFIGEINDNFKIPKVSSFITPITNAKEDEASYQLNKGMPFFIKSIDDFYEFHYVRAGLTEDKVKKLIKEKRIYIIP